MTAIKQSEQGFVRTRVMSNADTYSSSVSVTQEESAMIQARYDTSYMWPADFLNSRCGSRRAI